MSVAANPPKRPGFGERFVDSATYRPRCFRRLHFDPAERAEHRQHARFHPLAVRPKPYRSPARRFAATVAMLANPLATGRRYTPILKQVPVSESCIGPA